MLASYYLMKLSRSQKNQNPSCENQCSKQKKKTRSKTKTRKVKKVLPKCRVCLKETGEIPIYSNESQFNIAEALLLCGDINVHLDDTYPQHLCVVCHESLQKAFEFRTLAKQSDIILKTTFAIKEEYYEETKPIKTRKKSLENKDNDLEIHYEVVEQESLYTKRKVKCKLCSKIVTAMYFRSHLTSMHEKLHERKHVCDICGKAYRQLGSLSTHKRQHSNVFPFLCSSCPFRARYKNLLEIHMRRHSGEKKYMCSECPARYYTASNLSKHMRTHREPAFKCDLCGRPYRSKDNLKRHIEVEHLGIRKKYNCSLCGNVYSLKQQLYRHEIRKHGRQKSVYSRMPSYLEVQKDSNEEPI